MGLLAGSSSVAHDLLSRCNCHSAELLRIRHTAQLLTALSSACRCLCCHPQYFQAHKNAKANKELGTGSSLNLSTIY
jgi:hypothetical protein